jgi:acetyl-CoA synthetase
MNSFDHASIDYSSVSESRSAQIKDQLRRLDEFDDPAQRWSRISKQILQPSDPFQIHRDLFRENYREWDSGRGPEPAVLPEQATISASNLGMWLKELGFESYSEIHDFSVSQKEEFTKQVVERLNIRFQEKFDQVLDLSQGVERPSWFKGARMNIVDSIFDGELEHAAERTAVVFQREGSEGSTPVESWSLEQLKASSARVANGLTKMGLGRGDRVAIAMPMTADCVAIYLGVVRAGMCVVSIADSFAAEEIATRLRISEAKAIFTQDVIRRGGKIFPSYEKVVSAHAPVAVVLPALKSLQVRLREDDRAFDLFLSENTEFENTVCEPADAINILFSSGTTGDPKAIPWDHTTALRCALDGFVHQNLQPGDIAAWPTNVGWMMGPWLIFATLINKGCIALFDGMPHTREFGMFVEKAKVNLLGVVPSLVKFWKSSGCMDGLDWSSIKVFSSTGESSNGEEMLFLMALASYKPIIEYCGGTEVGGSYVSSTVIQPNCPSYFSAKSIGIDFRLLNEDGQDCQTGEVYLVPPALGFSTHLLNKDHDEVYFKDCPSGSDGEVLRRHGDEMQMSPGMYFRALGRADDTMNLGGIKVSSVELESVMNRVEGVAETAAIAVTPKAGGASQLVVYTVTEPGRWNDRGELKAELQTQIRQGLNPLFKIADVVLIDTLPRTASNKVMRRVLRAQYEVQ